MNRLVEVWLNEILKGIGYLFLNPLLYWAIILGWLVSKQRIKQERQQFGLKVFDTFSEYDKTFLVSIGIGIILSVIAVGTGFVFTPETVLLLSLVTIIISLGFRLSLLSPSYIIGLAFLIILLSPTLLSYQTYLEQDLFSGVNFTSLVILLSLLLFIEAFLTKRVWRNRTYPNLVKSQRGIWVGEHRIRKLHLIPFFVLLPVGDITPFASYWPYFSIGDGTYQLTLLPFLIGYDYKVKSTLPKYVANRIAKNIFYLGLIVLIFALGSMYWHYAAIIAVVIAIIGKEFINYRQRITERNHQSYFGLVPEGIKVLAVIPGSPADRLNILAGETIVKVNDKKIYSMEAFYESLQRSGAFFKLEVLDDRGEVRFIQSALYEKDHHELGILFPTEPYRKNK